jgi:hypothetical protein
MTTTDPKCKTCPRCIAIDALNRAASTPASSADAASGYLAAVVRIARSNRALCTMHAADAVAERLAVHPAPCDWCEGSGRDEDGDTCARCQTTGSLLCATCLDRPATHRVTLTDYRCAPCAIVEEAS